jgi:hypothetical protein
MSSPASAHRDHTPAFSSRELLNIEWIMILIATLIVCAAAFGLNAVL